uniref:Uncharacterized protein n=1 Tax=Chromera velia CCMP2878 TaxID=1169474 RepID=A0A0G4F105_9ALVE|eukprot:Cvel_14588.t1-p1 / transcript=Cvel_14588.t1 / gene=Cvel_14588 / organism=Chromera_velia_CCMP2878 / gene_product=hypothetical protein / transcript_product=hypothetical protein / location=Cvel_scaffold1043:20172-21669(+) / protein_length=439 / sequence_SO=supercontig / SO=protein_coding / is_pseudo=false
MRRSFKLSLVFGLAAVSSSSGQVSARSLLRGGLLRQDLAEKENSEAPQVTDLPSPRSSEAASPNPSALLSRSPAGVELDAFPSESFFGVLVASFNLHRNNEGSVDAVDMEGWISLTASASDCERGAFEDLLSLVLSRTVLGFQTECCTQGSEVICSAPSSSSLLPDGDATTKTTALHPDTTREGYSFRFEVRNLKVEDRETPIPPFFPPLPDGKSEIPTRLPMRLHNNPSALLARGPKLPGAQTESVAMRSTRIPDRDDSLDPLVDPRVRREGDTLTFDGGFPLEGTHLPACGSDCEHFASTLRDQCKGSDCPSTVLQSLIGSSFSSWLTHVSIKQKSQLEGLVESAADIEGFISGAWTPAWDADPTFECKRPVFDGLLADCCDTPGGGSMFCYSSFFPHFQNDWIDDHQTIQIDFWETNSPGIYKLSARNMKLKTPGF